MAYKVRLETFEGPLDLLFHLIEKNQLDISKISLTRIAEQYIEHIEQMQEMDLEVASEFLVLAAQLLEMKSNSLLPGRRKKRKETVASALIDRLFLYKKVRVVVNRLRQMEDRGLALYKRSPNLAISMVDRYGETAEDPLKGIDMNQFQSTYINATCKEHLRTKSQSETETEWEDMEAEAYTTSEKMEAIMALCRKYSRGFSFERVIKNSRSRQEKVVSFLALLELIKNKRVRIIQESLFNGIRIKKGDKWNDPNKY